MKCFLALILICIISTLNAAIYTITDEDGYVSLSSLKTGDYLEMTGGATGLLRMTESSTADILNTSKPYDSMNFTGISEIQMYSNANLYIYDGAINRIGTRDNSTATLYGGNINSIKSYQDTFYTEPVPGTNQTVEVWTPHITFVCDVDSILYVDNLLTGNWLDGSSFSITLIDGSLNPEYTAYDNIEFVPEPATICLLALGGLFGCRRKS
jgi:hypothetical protein